MRSRADKPVAAAGCRCGPSQRGPCRCHAASEGAGHTHSAVVPELPVHGGVPLSAHAQREWGRRFGGADFSAVRLHTESAAADAAVRLGAESWTVAGHIGFGPGRFRPDTAAGDQLLAHELAHVIQQRGAATVGNRLHADPGAEMEADRAAANVAASRPAGRIESRGLTGVARKPVTGGVTRVDVNGADKTITFNGPYAHTWRLTDCDLSDGDYDATVVVTSDKSGPLVSFRLKNAREGTRFQFSYRVEGREIAPHELVKSGQSVRIHATATPAAKTADAAAGKEDQVHFRVQVMDAATFEQASGRSADSLPEGKVVDGSGIRITPGAGFGARTAPYPFPRNTTGVLWTGQHMSDVAVVNGVPTVRGFRAPFDLHLKSVLERQTGWRGGQGGDATFLLNKGVPGSYAPDYWYLYSPGATLVHRGPLDPSASALGRDAIEGAAGSYNQTYRFSPPPPGTPGHERLSGGDPGYVCGPGENCINVPIKEHELMLGGRRPEIGPVTDPVDVASGVRKSTGQPEVFDTGRRTYSGPGYAQTADRWTAQPAEDFSARGLTATPITAGMYVRGVLKVGGTVLLIYGVYSTGERLADAKDDELGRVATEEAGSWLGGWVGSVIGSAIGGAVVCSESGPGAVVCAAAFGIAGGITGSTIGAETATGVYDKAVQVKQLLEDPAALNEAAVDLVGTDEQKRQFYDARDILNEAGF